ncbi:hypothetical protein COLO4_19634 [Corchorus olitorius]|uniref:Uncharacterized protein n=1 Tax=Corchorus olitorius TaxID=93759 RepID=A0A1R3J4D9_9ROSI|nr:hypothetical protein COLO4_19634 [Corchorus olitorius]
MPSSTPIEALPNQSPPSPIYLIRSAIDSQIQHAELANQATLSPFGDPSEIAMSHYYTAIFEHVVCLAEFSHFRLVLTMLLLPY